MRVTTRLLQKQNMKSINSSFLNGTMFLYPSSMFKGKIERKRRRKRKENPKTQILTPYLPRGRGEKESSPKQGGLINSLLPATIQMK